MEKQKDKLTHLSELGEFGLLKHLTKSIIIKNPSTLKGIGDDAAVISYDKEKCLVSTDLLVEGIHFDLIYFPLKHLGYKAAAVNFSDIYAMNGKPKQLTVSIAVSSKFTVEALEEFYEGLKKACDKYNVDIVGGDTSSSKHGFVISITVLGEIAEENIVYRHTAKESDLLCVSGDLGAAYIGLLILEREKKIFLENPNVQPDLKNQDYILSRQLKPEPRNGIIDWFMKNDVKPTAMIDISDGLASEILHICDASNVGCNLYEDKIPIDVTTYNKAIELNLEPTICALSGGEDYELLFTIAQKDYEKIKTNKDITVIGHITDKNAGTNLITKSNSSYPLTAQGWDAFLNNNKIKI